MAKTRTKKKPNMINRYEQVAGFYRAESDRVLLSRGKGKISRTFEPSENNVSASEVYAVLMTANG